MLSSTGCSRRLAANCTSATDPTMSSAQNASVRSMRPQLNSRGGGCVGRFVISGQARNVRQMAKVLGVVQPVPHQERVRRVEPDEHRFPLQPVGYVFVQQRANIETPGLTFL